MLHFFYSYEFQFFLFIIRYILHVGGCDRGDADAWSRLI
jgi:hypothetical protein